MMGGEVREQVFCILLLYSTYRIGKGSEEIVKKRKKEEMARERVGREYQGRCIRHPACGREKTWQW
jgi:hypothetical protein